MLARVVELVDTRDLKSLASNSVPVQVRLRVPYIYIDFSLITCESIYFIKCYNLNYNIEL